MGSLVDELASELRPMGGQYEALWNKFTQVLNTYTSKFVQSMNNAIDQKEEAIFQESVAHLFSIHKMFFSVR